MFSLPHSKTSSSKESHQGFTLIELMIAISVVAILSTIGLMLYTNSQKLARDARRKDDLGQIKNALVLYYQDNKKFPDAPSWVMSPGKTTNWLPALNSGYTDKVPFDPINSTTSCNMMTDSTCYGYGYYSGDWCYPGVTNNQHYLLTSRLENTNDPQAISVQYGGNPSSNCTTGGAGIYTLTN